MDFGSMMHRLEDLISYLLIKLKGEDGLNEKEKMV
jgi:hypothetical protein